MNENEFSLFEDNFRINEDELHFSIRNMNYSYEMKGNKFRSNLNFQWIELYISIGLLLRKPWQFEISIAIFSKFSIYIQILSLDSRKWKFGRVKLRGKFSYLIWNQDSSLYNNNLRQILKNSPSWFDLTSRFIFKGVERNKIPSNVLNSDLNPSFSLSSSLNNKKKKKKQSIERIQGLF